MWELFSDFLAFSMLIPIGIGLYKWHALSDALKSIWVLMVVSALVQAGALYLNGQKLNNLWLGHIFVPLEFMLLCNAYRLRLKKTLPQKLMLGLLAVFPLLAVANSLFLQDLKHNNSNIRTLEVALLVGLALSYFYALMKDMAFKRPERDPFFWVNTGVLIYLSSSLFLFMYSNYLLQYSSALGYLVWDIHIVFLTFYYIAIAIGLWTLPKKQNLPGSSL